MTNQALRISRAFITNQLARLTPSLYVKLTKQTGRGNEVNETPEIIAEYFQRCIVDYFEILGIPSNQQRDFLQEKTILEYGPGDIPGVALLLIAMGAKKIYCVDRFPLVSTSEKNLKVIEALADSLQEEQKTRLYSCLNGIGTSRITFNPDRIEYLIRPDGLSCMNNEVDLVISRAVLEHVNDLEATFQDMSKAMRPTSIALHQVDLKSHGLHRSNPLDFLQYSPWLWNMMYSHKGVPNRWRVNYYRDILARMPLEVLRLTPTAHFESRDVDEILGKLPEALGKIRKEDLSWQGFWLKCAKKI